MKNLKKVLALGLALVMLLGMFTVAAAAETEEKKMVASDLTDFGTVADSHKDAVSLAVDLEIIKGIKQDDGKYAFKPADPIDRASWAKMVYIAREGSDDASLYEGNTGGIKDIEGNWAEGYISYLASMKYISGDNNGNYNPSSTITVAAAYKMMLTVLGFDAEDRAYQNDSAWMANVLRDAKKNGLTSDVDASMTANVNLTRENAAQILYNTLNSRMREAHYGRDNGEKYVTGYSVLPYSLAYESFGLVKVTAHVDKLNDDGTAHFDTLSAYGLAPSGSEIFDNALKGSAKNVAQHVTVYAYGNLRINDYGDITSVQLDERVSSSLAAASSNVLKTVTSGVKSFANAFDPDHDDFVVKADTIVVVDSKDEEGNVTASHKAQHVDYYLNGTSETNVATVEAQSKTAGNVVEFIDNDDDGLADTVKVTTYIVKVANADVEVATRNDKEQVRINGIIGWTDTTKVNGYADIKKGDVVLVSELKSDNKVVSTTIEKAEKATGNVTSINNSKKTITVAGKAYDGSGIADATVIDELVAGTTTADMSKWNSGYKNEYDFFLDKNGSVCHIELVSEDAKTDVAVVLRSTWISGNQSLSNGSSAYGEAELLFTDGTSEIVKVVKIKANADADAEDVTEEDVKQTKGADGKWDAGALANQFVEVSEGSNGWTVTKVTKDATITNKDITAAPKFDGTNSANNNTVFLIGKGPDDDGNYAYSAYTGHSNIPGMQSASGFTYTVKDGAVVADYVYLTAKVFDGDVPEGYIYVKDAADFSTNSDGNVIYSIVDAEGDADATLTMSADAAKAVTAAGFYSVTGVDEDGLVTKVTAIGNLTPTPVTAQDVKDSGSGLFVTDKTYGYDNATVCVVIDVKAEDKSFIEATTFAPDSLDITVNTETDPAKYNGNYSSVKAVVVGDENKVASYIYVIRESIPAPVAAE